jgi:hypothetical protein
MDLIEEFRGLLDCLNREGVAFALCGGLAMAVYAFPRATLDIDLLIPEEQLDKAKQAAIDAGFTLDAGLMTFKQGRSKIYRMTKITLDDPEPIMVDFLLVTPELHPAWETARRVSWQHGEIPVVSPEGLILLKELRGSGQDKDDIRHLRSFLGHEKA